MKKIILLLIVGWAVTTRLFAAIAPIPAATPNPNCLPDSLCPDWVTRYDGADHLYDHAFGIVTSPDGSRLYVAGASTSTAGALDFLTAAYNSSTGEQVWTARYDGPAHGNDAPYGSGTGTAIVISSDGGMVFVTGRRSDANGKYEYFTIAYHTSDGSEVWAREYATPEESQATALALSSDGRRLYVTGYSALAIAAPPAPAIANYDFGTVAYDTATGEQLWIARYEGPALFWDVPYAIDVASVRQPDGIRRDQVFVTGRSNGASSGNADADFATVAYDGLTGAQLWVARYNGPANDRDLAYAIGASPDGSSVFVTGESTGITSDYATICYDSLTGEQRWVARYAQSDLDLSLGLAVSPAGNRVAVTGFSVNPGALTVIDRSATTVVYDAATGAEVWVARHSEIDGAASSRVAFSRNGRRLYVAGLENGNVVGVGGGGVGGQVGHAPALTLAYDVTDGTELWATHYLGPAGDEGNSGLAVGPDGTHVFVTGGGQSEGADFSTLSYSTGEPAIAPVSLDKVVSSKIHGDAGAFEIELPHGEVILGPGIECRHGGPNGEYMIIFTFANPLSAVAFASTTCGIISSSGIDNNDLRRYVVNLSQVTCNAAVVQVTLNGVIDVDGNSSSEVPVLMGLLIGDTSADGSVNSADISQTKSQSGHAVTISNFREDVTADGSINSADISLVKSKSGTALP